MGEARIIWPQLNGADLDTGGTFSPVQPCKVSGDLLETVSVRGNCWSCFAALPLEMLNGWFGSVQNGFRTA